MNKFQPTKNCQSMLPTIVMDINTNKQDLNTMFEQPEVQFPSRTKRPLFINLPADPNFGYM